MRSDDQEEEGERGEERTRGVRCCERRPERSASTVCCSELIAKREFLETACDQENHTLYAVEPLMKDTLENYCL